MFSQTLHSAFNGTELFFFFGGQEKNVSKGLTFVNLNISLYYLKNA